MTHSAENDALANILRSLANDTPTLALAAQNHLIAQHDYMGQGLGFLVNPWAETLRTIADGLCPIPPEVGAS